MQGFLQSKYVRTLCKRILEERDPKTKVAGFTEICYNQCDGENGICAARD